ASLLLAAGLAIFWPGRNAVPGAAHAVAQDASKLPAAGSKSTDDKTTPRGEPTLEDMLNQRIDVDFSNVPLKDAIAFIQEQTGIQFVIKEKNLEEASLSSDAPVSKRLKRVRVSTLLDLLLEDLELSYVDR